MVGKILSGGRQKLIRIHWWILSLLLLVFNCTALAHGIPLPFGKAQATSQQAGPEGQAASQDLTDPDKDLPGSAKKLMKLKVIRKFTPQPPQPARVAYKGASPLLTIAAFDALPRPAYYTFLFRYTPF